MSDALHAAKLERASEAAKHQDMVTQNVVLKHRVEELERKQEKKVASRTWNVSWLTCIFLAFAVWSALVGYASAETAEKPDHFSSVMDTFTNFAYKPRGNKPYVAPDPLTIEVRKAIRNVTEFVREHWRPEFTWVICSIGAALFAACTAQRPWLILGYLAITACTGGGFVDLAVSPAHTAWSSGSHALVTAIYHFDPLAGLSLSIVTFAAAALIFAVMSDELYLVNIKAFGVSTIIVWAKHIAAVLGMNVNYLGFVVIALRLYRLLVAGAPGTTIEIKDTSGKVVKKTRLNPNYLWQKFKQGIKMAQLRRKTAPQVRIQPQAIVKIIAGESVGTGFLAGNHILTCSHVVGNEKVVQVVCEEGAFDAGLDRHLDDKDTALLKIPTELMTKPKLKIAKEVDASWVCIASPLDGALSVTVTEGFQHGDTLSYIVQTRNGQSGSPVLDANGHVIGIHQTNTGSTGGAIVVHHKDVHPPSKTELLNEEVKRLKEKLKEVLGEKMGEDEPQAEAVAQAEGNSADDIVALIRYAIGREMKILRDELAAEDLLQKKKGKNKQHRRHGGHSKSGKKGKKKVFTEKEYQEMLDKGLTREEIRALADARREAESDSDEPWEDGPHRSFDVGYEDYPISESDEDDDPNSWYARSKPRKQMEQSWWSWGPDPKSEDYSDEAMDLGKIKELLEHPTKAEAIILKKELKVIKDKVEEGKGYGQALYEFDVKANQEGLPPVGPEMRKPPTPTPRVKVQQKGDKDKKQDDTKKQEQKSKNVKVAAQAAASH
nr:MAG: ORF1a [Canine astrovirus]